MVQIEFEYYQNKILIQGNLEDKFDTIINRYKQKIGTLEYFSLDNNSLTFLANGKKLNLENTVESHMNQLNKENKKIKVLVDLAGEEKKKVEVQSKDIICPKCHEPCKFKIENYKIKLYDCINNHVTDNIKIINFKDTQILNISEIKCDICKNKNKGDCYNYEFYKCFTCSINLCPLCKSIHDKTHIVKNYDHKDYICPRHEEFFTKYCKSCKMNLCFICEKEHNEHDRIDFGDLMPDMDKLKEQLSEIKKVIDVFKKKVEIIVKKLNDLAQSTDIYYEIQNNIKNNFDIKNRNYNILQNVNQ